MGPKVEVEFETKIDHSEFLEKLLKYDVFVGVFEDSPRLEGGLTNAQIGHIMENGSPAQNIPARPVLYPGVKNGQNEINRMMKEAAAVALSGGSERDIYQKLFGAGEAAANSVRREFMNGAFEPLKAATLAARRRRGWSGIRPLLDTSQYRRAISHKVVKK